MSKKLLSVVRFRPSSDGGRSDGLFQYSESSRGIINIHNPLPASSGRIADREFLLDTIIPHCSQADFFAQTMKPYIDHAVAGNDVCIFSSGHTGSGKTFTLLGDSSEAGAGLLPRTLDALFVIAKERHNQKKRFTIHLSAHENFCEIIRDMGIQHKGKGFTDHLPILEVQDVNEGAVLVNSALNYVGTTAEAMHIINAGRSARARNTSISKALVFHVVTVHINQSDPEKGIVESKMHFVDLPSSGVHTMATGPQRTRESELTMHSMDALAGVISTLNNGKYSDIVPFHESKLTKLLKESLQFEGKMMMITNIDPTPSAYQNNYTALSYGARCRNMRPSDPSSFDLSTDPEQQSKLIGRLNEEIAMLKEQLASSHEFYNRRLADLATAAVVGGNPPGSSGSTRRISNLSEAQSAKAGGAGEGSGASSPVLGAKEGKDPAVLTLPPLAGADVMNVTSNLGAVNIGASSARQTMEIKELKEKLHRRGLELRELRATYTTSEKHLRQEIESQRQRANQYHTELRELRQSSEERVRAVEERFSKEIDVLRENSEKAMLALNSKLDIIPANFKETSHTLRTLQDSRAEEQARLAKEQAEARKQLDESKNTALAQQKAQYEFWLEKKVQELKGFVRQYNTYKQQKEEEIAVLQSQLISIFEYADGLSRIIERYENGLYAVYDKTGIKTVHLPASHKPGALPEAVMRTIQRYRQRADDFLYINKIAEAQTAPVSPTHQERGETPTNQNLPTAARNEDRVSNRQREKERMKVEEELLNELADHPTVEYIRRLEDERDLYKNKLSEEVESNRHAKIALDSKERQITRLKSSLSQTGRSSSLSMLSPSPTFSRPGTLEKRR